MDRDEKLNQHNRLIELGGSDFEIADDEPDIRGWTVKDAQGKTIGEVDELIFDPESRKVRYLVLDLEGNVLDLEPRNVLIPIGLAELHDAQDDVVLPGITATQLNALPKYDKSSLTSDIETSIRNAFAGVGAAGAALTGSSQNDNSEDFYSHDYYNEDNLYRNRHTSATAGTEEVNSLPVIEEQMQVGKQTVETGGARIRTRIVERPVEENLRLRQEQVQIERNPVNRPATESDFDTFKEGSIDIIEHAEVPVVSKEARVVEEISLEKAVEEREETIRGTVRETEIDVERFDTGETRRSTDV